MPLILLNIVHFTAVEEFILNAIIAAHNIDEVFTDHGGMLLPHLVHTLLLDQIILLRQELVYGAG